MDETAAHGDSELHERSRQAISAGESAVANLEKALKEAREMLDHFRDTLGEESQEPGGDQRRQPK